MPEDASTPTTLRAQIAALDTMTLAELRAEYQRAFGEPTYSCHKTYVRKRVAWGLQVREQGGLTARGHPRDAARRHPTGQGLPRHPARRHGTGAGRRL